MNKLENNALILIAEDDPDDRLLIKEALEENNVPSTVHFVEDGEELLNYLYNRDQYHNKIDLQKPAIIILDLNMPKKDGREVLKELKSIPELKYIPIVILTTSSDEEDIKYTYAMGASSFITKPSSFDSMVDMMRVIKEYWLGVTELPSDHTNNL